ncbi:MAG: CRTAC1 family protein [Chloroflexi bacterium]|nr:CRTAC1 family protein [Chloroflexota bacterium]
MAAAALAGTILLTPPPTRAAPGLCVNVAQERGLVYRGAYGGTPWAFNPMSAVMLRNMGNGAAVTDYDADGDLDVLMLGQLGHGNALFRNGLAESGSASFTDQTAAAGLANTGGSRVAAFADLDNDGDQDLVVVNDWDGEGRGTPSTIWRNNGDGTFADVTPGSRFAPTGYLAGGLALADYDRDGLLDLYITYWTMELGGDPSDDGYAKGQFPARNKLFRNEGGLTFADVTTDAGLGEVQIDSFTPIFADFTADGWPDLYVAVDHRPDLFFVSEGGSFRSAAREFGLTHVGNDMGVAVADLEHDGLLDLYATNISDETGKFGNGQGNTLMRATRDAEGRVVYEDQASDLGVADTGWGWGTAFTDMDLDGDIDLYAAQGMQEFLAQQAPELRAEEAHLFLNEGDLTFREATKNGCDIVGDQRAVVPFDYDRDGDPDLLISQVAYHATLLENQTSGQGWLTVDLAGAGVQAAGARVTVTVAGGRSTQVALFGGSYLAGMPLELYFGLGAATGADDVTITWADGTTTRLGPVEGDRIVTVTPEGIRE